MWPCLITSGILLRREDVRLALRELDPENVDKRQRQRLTRENIATQVSVMYGILTFMINLSLMVSVLMDALMGILGALLGWKLHRLIKCLN